MPPTMTKDEYLAATAGPEEGYGATQDYVDPTIGTTVQGADIEDDERTGIPAREEGLPGQVYAVHQLPDPKVARHYGLPAVKVPAHLIVDGGEAETHPQGPDSLDLVSAGLREQLGNPKMDNHTGAVSADDADADDADGDEGFDPSRPASDYRHDELVAFATAAGVDSSGTKAEIHDRLVAASSS